MKTALSKPIYDLVFKFAFFSTDQSDTLPRLKVDGDKDDKGRPYTFGRNKDFETKETFIHEAAVQQDIYTSTLFPNGNPITLSIVDFSFFNDTAASQLLTKLLTLTPDRPVQQILQYLITESRNPRSLGLITMQLADSGLMELADVNDGDIKDKNYELCLSQLVLLFAKTKIMNFDCHNGNVLASDTEQKTVLIDFGRTINFNIPQDQEGGPSSLAIALYNRMTGNLYDADKMEIMKFDENKLLSNRTQTRFSSSSRDGSIVAAKIIKFIALMDYTTYMTMYDTTGRDLIPQMSSLIKYIYDSQYSDNWVISPQDWTPSPDIDAKYDAITKGARKLFEAPIRQTNVLNQRVIKSKIADDDMFLPDENDIENIIEVQLCQLKRGGLMIGMIGAIFVK